MRSAGVSPDEASLASILSACSNIQSYERGYAQTNIEEAVRILYTMLDQELKPSEVTFACLLDACNGPSKLHFGKQIHNAIIKVGHSYGDEYLAVSLLSMYINSQEKADAARLFSELPSPKSTVLWTVAISGYTQNDSSEEALLLFYEMRHHNIFCFLKCRKKKTSQEADHVHVDEHMNIKEKIVQGPLGGKAVVVTIEDDVHVEEEMRKNEQIAQAMHMKSAGAESSFSSGHHQV
ncbi:hypothetical protein ACET3Z_000807 [Daucus carota]